MNSILNRLFQKSTVIEATSIDLINPYQEFLQYFYYQGIASKKLDVLKEKINRVDFNSDSKKSLYQLVQCYLEIEQYLLFHDVGFLGNATSLRTELQDFFPLIANSQPFSVLYKEGSAEEITLALSLANYLHREVTEYCDYVSVLESAFVLDKEISLDLVNDNIVYYLSCKRKIREYIDTLSIETHRFFEEKTMINPFNKWASQFTDFYQNLKVSDKITHYLSEKTPIASSVTIPIATPVRQDTSSLLQVNKNHTLAVSSSIDISLFEAMFENMLDSAILFERGGKVILANERARDVFNFSKKNLNKQNIFELLPEEIAQSLKEDTEEHTYNRKKKYFRKKRRNSLVWGRWLS